MQDRQSIFPDSNDFSRKSLQLPILKEHEGLLLNLTRYEIELENRYSLQLKTGI